MSQWGSKRRSLLLSGSEIAELENAVLDAVTAIASGAIAGAANQWLTDKDVEPRVGL